MSAAPILDALLVGKFKEVGPGHWKVPCPCHVDQTPSLDVKEVEDGAVLLYDHGGCATEAIVEKLGLTMADLFVPKSNGAAEPARPRVIVATYDYTDEDGNLLYQTVRYDPKDFRQRRPNGQGWTWNVTGVRRVPYRLTELLASTRGVVIVEGEKDVDKVAELGFTATSNVGGAGKWQPEYSEWLRDRDVVIIGDNDESGRDHVQDVARKLHGIAATIRTLELPGLASKGDVSDWLDAGHTADELKRLLNEAPMWEPSDHLPPAPSRLRFYTPVELATMTQPKPDWVVGPGLVAVGAITEIDGKIKAAGKTTLMLGMVGAILEGASFLGQPTRQARVVYVTEQTRQTFMDALRRAGLADRCDELRILFREDFGAATWPEIVAMVRQQDGYDVAVFDTIGKLARLRDENAASEWSDAMTPLQDLAASGRAVILGRHDRKSGGEVGESGRGSSQGSGDADIILALRRPEGNQPSNRRVLETLSRYPDTPEKMVVELTSDGYVLLGSDEAVALADAVDFVSDVIASEFWQTHSGLSMSKLEELGKARSPKVPRSTIQAALDKLMSSGDATRSGAGKAHHPYVYTYRSSSAENQETAESAETRDIYGRHDSAASEASFADRFGEVQGVAWSAVTDSSGTVVSGGEAMVADWCSEPVEHQLLRLTTSTGERHCRTCSPIGGNGANHPSAIFKAEAGLA
jgi:5S rRNA maturation endonuclease (ribonuclease M5)